MANPNRLQTNKFQVKKINIKKPSFLLPMLFVIIFSSVGAMLFLVTHAAGPATLSISPATSTVALGTTSFTVTITEDSTTTASNAVNAVQANLTYDATKFKCAATPIDMSTSAFNQFVMQQTCANGLVKIAGARSTGVTGVQTVAKVTFEAIGLTTTAAPTTPIAFDTATSEVIKLSDASNILGTATGGNYTISDLTPPTTPTGVFKQSSTPPAITLGWTSSTDIVGVTGYKVFRNGTQIGTSGTNSFYDAGPLSAGSSYSYTVLAYDAAGNPSGTSTAFVYTPADIVAPTVPTGLNLTSATTGSITFGWAPSTDAVGVAGYKIYRSGGTGGAQVYTTTTNSFTNNTNMYVGTNYTYNVSAYDSATNESAKSVASSFRTAYLAGDTNNDGRVDNTDLLAISIAYGILTGATRANGDFNNDGKVTISDAATFAANWATNLYP